MNCTICGSSSSVLFSGLSDTECPQLSFTYTLRRCHQCQLIFIAPQPSLQQLFQHYPDNYHAYTVPVHVKAISLFLMKSIARQYCGYGKSTWIKKLGWQVEGVEPNEKVVTAIRSRGDIVHHGSLETVTLPSRHYDAIHLSHVFEHLPNLYVSLRKITYLLKEGGELILAVPNNKSVLFKLFRQYHDLLRVPTHLYHFNETNLTLLLEKYYFSITKICHHQFLGSFVYGLSRCLNKQDYLRKSNNFILNKLHGCYVRLASSLDPIFHFLKAGDAFIIHARYMPPSQQQCNEGTK